MDNFVFRYNAYYNLIMTKLLSRLIFSFISNLVALFAAGHFVEGFIIGAGFPALFLAAGVLVLINIFIRPVLKLVFAPIIILTFGLGTFLVNALIIYLLDIFLVDITITGLKPLFYATLIISFVNILINFSAKRVYK
ncbi:hypothetical protein COS61_02770 [Candidatus Wolfebacteria bacterium CG03_land_8_20_14_0_80_40_12]|uniref:Phage holin family protein n=1 Tax=Candidatus Wolfebacteria bacterium CG03_land_8_20_14_0_80_40_12 TaxID=1975069 RepID=A0A2M7B508_9BACT|nr:MAG: hypothetical protein COS61_02770 [Candidatus Wolfebacteria bacterium CG03_land_8_20_14_0_80_40_12]